MIFKHIGHAFAGQNAQQLLQWATFCKNLVVLAPPTDININTLTALFHLKYRKQSLKKLTRLKG